MTGHPEFIHSIEHPPILLSGSKDARFISRTLIETFPRKDDDVAIANAVRKVAKRSGIEYLFEVPGALLDENDPFCCVVRHRDETLHHGFVACDRETGMIRLINYEEVPEKAREFFASYVSVLSCLNGLEHHSQLH